MQLNKRMFSALGISLLFLCSANAQAQFTPGSTYSLSSSAPYGARDVTAGGDVSGAGLLIPLPERSPGQAAFSLDKSVMYVTLFDTDRVVTITPAGVLTNHATGINGPTGLVMTSDGRLLVVSFFDNQVFDVTAAGDYSASAAFATGFSGGRNLTQLADGTVLLADQSNRVVHDLNYPAGAR